MPRRLAQRFGVGSRAGESSPFSEDGYWSCQSIQADNTVYITPLFEIKPGPQEVRGAFAQALYDTYAFKGQATCSVGDRSASSRETIEAGRQAQITAWKSAGVKVIEVDWAYSASTSLRYLCFGGMRVVTATERTNHFFINRVQQTTAAEILTLQNAWGAHLQNLYPGAYIELKSCQLAPADPVNLQSLEESLEAQWKGLGGAITRTDWKFSPDAQTQ